MSENEISLIHKVLPPKESSENPPLIIMLHGYGSNENDLFSMAPMLNQKAVVVSLRAPQTLPWGGFAWYEIDFEQAGRGKMSNIQQAKESIALLQAEIPKIQRKYSAGPQNTWLFGFSQGCILSYALSLNEPEKFPNVIALSGYVLKEVVPSSFQPANLAKLDYFVSHGTADEVLPVAWARASVKMLEELKINHQYREYPIGHGVSPEAFEDLKNWLRKKGVI